VDFLNKVPVGTIGVEGSQLNLLWLVYGLSKLEVPQPEVAGLALCRLAECLDAGVMVCQEGGEGGGTGGSVGFLEGRLTVS